MTLPSFFLCKFYFCAHSKLKSWCINRRSSIDFIDVNPNWRWFVVRTEDAYFNLHITTDTQKSWIPTILWSHKSGLHSGYIYKLRQGWMPINIKYFFGKTSNSSVFSSYDYLKYHRCIRQGFIKTLLNGLFVFHITGLLVNHKASLRLYWMSFLFFTLQGFLLINI